MLQAMMVESLHGYGDTRMAMGTGVWPWGQQHCQGDTGMAMGTPA